MNVKFPHSLTWEKQNNSPKIQKLFNKKKTFVHHVDVRRYACDKCQKDLSNSLRKSLDEKSPSNPMLNIMTLKGDFSAFQSKLSFDRSLISSQRNTMQN